MQLLVRGGQQGGVVGLGQAAALSTPPAVHDQPAVQVPAVPGPVGEQPGHRDPARAPCPTPARPGCARAGPRSAPGAGAGSPPASSSKQIHPPCRAASLAPSPRSPRATRRWRPRRARPRGGPGPAGSSRSDAADTTPRAGCRDPEQAVDQRGDPGQGPPLIGPVGPVLGGRAPVQLVGEPVELGVGQFAHRPARAAGGQRRRCPRRSKPAATRGPTWCSPAAARRSCPSASCCSNISAACNRTRSRAARPRAVSPPPSACLMYTGVDPTRAEDHGGAPSVINQPNPDLSTSGSGRCAAIVTKMIIISVDVPDADRESVPYAAGRCGRSARSGSSGSDEESRGGRRTVAGADGLRVDAVPGSPRGGTCVNPTRLAAERNQRLGSGQIAAGRLAPASAPAAAPVR